MIREIKYRKAFNFDLDTKTLKQVYPLGEKNYTRAYMDIKRFFLNQQFEHRQGSGYCSMKEMTSVEVFDIIDELRKTLPWLGDCIKKFDVTNIGETHELTSLLQNKSMEIKPMSKHKKPSILSALAQAKEKADALNTNRPIKPKSKNKEIER